MRPILSPLNSVNHRLPSGPAAMPNGLQPNLFPHLVGRGNEAKLPPVVMRPMLFPKDKVNHRLPSGPAVMPAVSVAGLPASRPARMATCGSPCPSGTASDASPPAAVSPRSPCPRGVGTNLAASHWASRPGRMATCGSPSSMGTRLGASPRSRARVNTHFKLGIFTQLKVCIDTHDFMLLSTMQYVTTSPCLPLSHFRIRHISWLCPRVVQRDALFNEGPPDHASLHSSINSALNCTFSCSSCARRSSAVIVLF